MVADAWHTLSDCVTSFVAVAGFWMASQPADRRHPFGHGRSESIASIIIGTLLIVVGVTFLYESALKLIQRQGMGFSRLAIAVFGASALLKEALAQFAFWTARKADAASLKADAWHHRSDAIAALLIVGAALFSHEFWWLDGALGMIVSLLILHASYGIITGSASYLLGELPSGEKMQRVCERVQKEFPDLKGIHHVHVHQYGDHHEVTAHLMVPGNMSVHEAHDIASRVEQILEKEFHGDATVHVEPEKSKQEDG